MAKPPTIDFTMTTSAGDIEMLSKLSGKKFEQEGNQFPIKKPPDLTGIAGKAWTCDIERGLEIEKIRPEDNAAICEWLVEAPQYHPIWHSYAIICVHLRPMSDSRPTKMYLEGATHELWLYALSPDSDQNILVETGSPAPKSLLQPKNFAAQFIELDDNLAVERIKNTVQEILDGKLSPDTDHQMEWRRRFGSNMIKAEYK